MTGCAGVADAGALVPASAIQKNDLVWSSRGPGRAPSWNRVVAADAQTVTFVNGARVTREWFGGMVPVFRPRVILGGP